jgi:hypothetical protein
MKNSTAVGITCVMVAAGVAAKPHVLEHAPPSAVLHTFLGVASSTASDAVWHGGTIIPDSMRDAEYDVSPSPLSWLLARNDK